MSKTKSNLHTIICDYVPLYYYIGEVLVYKDFGKNKDIKKRDLQNLKGTYYLGSVN